MLSGTVHGYPAADRQPAVRLTQWQVMKSLGHDGKLSRRLVGRCDYEGRKSSAIKLFDLIALQATTASGRCYTLIGPPGEDLDAMWVWDQFAADRANCWDVTRAVLRLRRRKLLALERAKAVGGGNA
jgi:hypothetical protein